MTTSRQVLAEFLGSAGLLVAIVGSGIMGETLSQGNAAIALLANSIATGAALYALIQTFGPISGAHFNPVVSLVEFLQGKLALRKFVHYSVAQVLGAVFGVFTTHLMFGLSYIQLSSHNRGEWRFVISEVIATTGLILVIALAGKRDVRATPPTVALYITSAYWCTSSTSFANPAVTIARCMTDSFSGILWTSVPGFISAQILGALIGYVLSKKFL